jgi:sortase B
VKKGIRVILIVVLLGIFALSAYKIGEYYYSRLQSEKMQQTLIGQVVTVQPPAPPVSQEEPDATPVEQAPIAVDFEALAAQNPDVIGWIYLENTCIHYPVMQAGSNDEYLHRLFDGTWSFSGTPFADYRHSGDFTDFQTTVYGHNMKNGTMFAPITQYQSQEFYEENPVMWLLTPDGSYKVELIAGLLTDDKGIAQLSTVSKTQAEDFLAEIREKSTFRSGVEATAEDRYLILSTCHYGFENARYAVVGKLTPV